MRTQMVCASPDLTWEVISKYLSECRFDPAWHAHVTHWGKLVLFNISDERTYANISPYVGHPDLPNDPETFSVSSFPVDNPFFYFVTYNDRSKMVALLSALQELQVWVEDDPDDPTAFVRISEFLKSGD